MPTEIVMPRLGWDMKVGSVAEWLKGPGERVEAGEVVCLIDGDKATTELEAPASGTLHLPGETPEVGQEVPVGTLLAYLLAPGEVAPPDGVPAHGGAAGSASDAAAAEATDVGGGRAPNAGLATVGVRPSGRAAGATGGEAGGDLEGLGAAGHAAAVTTALQVAATAAGGAPAAGMVVAGDAASAQRPRSAAGEVTLRGGAASDVALGGGGAGVGAAGDAGLGRVVASPRARRAAAALGLDWRTLVGSGRGGRILERDVQRAAPASAAPAATAATPTDATTDGSRRAEAADVDRGMAESAATPVPLHGLRRLTAERMALSARTVAPVTLVTEADATALVRLREQAKAEQHQAAAERNAAAAKRSSAAAAPKTAASEPATEGVPSVIDLLLKIVALALVEQPGLNASLTETGVVQHREVHVAVAMDTPRGLIAPVVHHTQRRTVEEIAHERRRLSEAALAGRLRPADLEGATFTISNLGTFEVDAFTPIVPLPQCAILGLGRIVARPVVIDEATEQIAVRRMLTLSLSFDHRLVDGAPAARFLQRIKHLVERPTLWLFR